jgi:DNA-binding transcriptional ArsR family regulator
MKAKSESYAGNVRNEPGIMPVLAYKDGKKIVELLLDKNELTITEICFLLKMDYNNIRAHLKILKKLGILKLIMRRKIFLYSFNKDSVIKIAGISESYYNKK